MRVPQTARPGPSPCGRERAAARTTHGADRHGVAVSADRPHHPMALFLGADPWRCSVMPSPCWLPPARRRHVPLTCACGVLGRDFAPLPKALRLRTRGNGVVGFRTGRGTPPPPPPQGAQGPAKDACRPQAPRTPAGLATRRRPGETLLGTAPPKTPRFSLEGSNAECRTRGRCR